MWHELSEIKKNGETDFSTSVKTDKNSLWFDGHFDEKPILPGIAQAAMVFEAIKKNELFTMHKDLKIKTIKKVRFRRLISPEEEININIKKNSESPDIFNFKIHVNGELSCSGIIETYI